MRPTPGLALAVAAAIASLTACSSTEDVSAVAPSTTASAVVPSEAATTPATAPATTEPTEDAGDSEATTTEVADACQFATDSVLIAALANSRFRSEQPMSFDEVRCSSPFAVARTSLENGRVQAAGVLFEYDFDTAEWTALDIGSAMSCAQYGVTPEKEAALEGCGS